MRFSRNGFFFVFLVPWLGGCGAAAHSSAQATPSRFLQTEPPSTAMLGGPLPGVSSSGGQRGPSDLERLALLWHARTQDSTIADYPVGPGDVLEISVPDMEELSSRTVRVARDGTVTLPFIGLVKTTGLTEQQLVAELRRRLEERYMYDPQVNLFVREYRSRQVAVIGAVEKPGLYSLSSETETILDLLSQAGGMKNDAAAHINFVPAEPVDSGQAAQLASLLPIGLRDDGRSPLLIKKTDPLVIDLKSLAKGGNQIYLSLPVRPGDVIMVPGAGEVLIQGWVEKPGSYRVTPGLTVLGAVAAAGGSLFAADTGSIKIVRINKDGEKVFLDVNLEKIKHGEEVDIPLQEGDVIDVASSTAKLVPYGLYRFFSTVVHVGASAPLF